MCSKEVTPLNCKQFVVLSLIQKIMIILTNQLFMSGSINAASVYGSIILITLMEEKEEQIINPEKNDCETQAEKNQLPYEESQIEDLLLQAKQEVSNIFKNHSSVVKIFITVGNKLYNMRKYSEAIGPLSEARQISKFFNVEHNEKDLLFKLAFSLSQVNKPDESNYIFNKLINLYSDEQDEQSHKAYMYSIIGRNHESKNCLQDALKYYQMAQKIISEKMKEEVDQKLVDYKTGIARVYYNMKDYEQSKFYYLQVLDMRKKQGSPEALNVHFQLITTYYHTKQYIQFFEEAYQNFTVGKYQPTFGIQEKKKKMETYISSIIQNNYLSDFTTLLRRRFVDQFLKEQSPSIKHQNKRYRR